MCRWRRQRWQRQGRRGKLELNVARSASQSRWRGFDGGGKAGKGTGENGNHSQQEAATRSGVCLSEFGSVVACTTVGAAQCCHEPISFVLWPFFCVLQNPSRSQQGLTSAPPSVACFLLLLVGLSPSQANNRLHIIVPYSLSHSKQRKRHLPSTIVTSTSDIIVELTSSAFVGVLLGFWFWNRAGRGC